MHDNPLDVVLFVADVCQLKCKYCYNKFPRTCQLADLSQFFEFIKKILAETKRPIKDLVLVGGEPTLHPELSSLIHKLLSLDIQNVILWTNFEQDLQSYYIPLLERGCKLAMSWHGKDDDKKNLAFVKKALQLPDKYIELGQIVELDLMAEQDNFESFSLAFKMLQPKYKQTTCIWPVYTTDLVIGDYTAQQLKLWQQMSTKLERQVFQVEYEDDGSLKMPTPSYNYCGWKCNAGLDYIYVHCNGNVYNCQSYYQFNQLPLFNLKDLGDVNLADFLKPCKCNVQSCRFADYQVHREKEEVQCQS